MRGPWLGIAALAAAIAPSATSAAYLHEYPHPPVVVNAHPRGDRPFRLHELQHALELGASAAELDLRWRLRDSSVVCAHRLRDVEGATTLEDALQAVTRFQDGRSTVHGDGRQFFLVLDLKEERPEFHRVMVRTLAAHADRFATSGAPSEHPRGITVVVSGFRAALERAIPAATLDTLCILEGRDYGDRIRVSEGEPRFQWIAIEYPIDRERVRAFHDGQDGWTRGRFNVRVIAAGSHVARVITMGADAVNADLDVVAPAVAAAREVERRH